MPNPTRFVEPERQGAGPGSHRWVWGMQDSHSEPRLGWWEQRTEIRGGA